MLHIQVEVVRVNLLIRILEGFLDWIERRYRSTRGPWIIDAALALIAETALAFLSEQRHAIVGAAHQVQRSTTR